MDPITAAIVSALTIGLQLVAPPVVNDAYEALKALIKKKLGHDSDVSTSVTRLEKDPSSAAREASLHEDIIKAKADQDPEILQAAQALLAHINAQPDGKAQIQKAVGNYNIQVQGSSNTITQNKGQ